MAFFQKLLLKYSYIISTIFFNSGSACKLATTFLVFSAINKYDLIVAENSENMALNEKKSKETKKGKK